MAVYTHIPEAAARDFLSRYDIGSFVSLTGIAEGVSNSNYRLETTQGLFILTLFETRTRAGDLPYFIALMQWCREHDIPCPAVIADKSGARTGTLAERPAIIISFLPGTSTHTVSEAQARAAGELLGRLHKAGETFPQHRKNSLGAAEWARLIASCNDPRVPALQEEWKYLEQNAPQGLPQGAIHADLFPDNVFFMGTAVSGVIDFYFACTDVFVYDLMLTLNAWCFDGGVFNSALATAFLAGYEPVRPLTAAERAALPFYGRMAALRIIATRLYDRLHQPPGAVVTFKDPADYVEILSFYRNGKWPA